MPTSAKYLKDSSPQPSLTSSAQMDYALITKRTEAIQNSTTPRSPSEVKSLLEMVQYLVRQDVIWKWLQTEQEALDKLKKLLLELRHVVLRSLLPVASYRM